MKRAIIYENISVVIPVKDDEQGVIRAVNKLQSIAKPPAEIIVVDNRSASPLSRASGPLRRLSVTIIDCEKPGPAAARNRGWREATHDWILFMDSDCIPDDSVLSGYERKATEAIAFAGDVRALGNDTYSRYYDAQRTLVPPSGLDDSPIYLVTANCLVLRSALVEVGGFDESFTVAGGEDIDLGWRLKALGSIEFSLSSVMKHDFRGTARSFTRRFVRYGYGTGQVALKNRLDLRPRYFQPRESSRFFTSLSLVQFFGMMFGYELALRGVAL